MSSQASRQIRSIVGDNIYAARDARRLSQSKLAAELGMNSIAVSRWERGKTLPDPVATMPRLAEALGVEIGWLYTDHGRKAA